MQISVLCKKGLTVLIIYFTLNLAENQSIFRFLLPNILRTSLICKQCFLGQVLRKRRYPETGQLACWDIPKPLSIITS